MLEGERDGWESVKESESSSRLIVSSDHLRS